MTFFLKKKLFLKTMVCAALIWGVGTGIARSEEDFFQSFNLWEKGGAFYGATSSQASLEEDILEEEDSEEEEPLSSSPEGGNQEEKESLKGCSEEDSEFFPEEDEDDDEASQDFIPEEISEEAEEAEEVEEEETLDEASLEEDSFVSEDLFSEEESFLEENHLSEKKGTERASLSNPSEEEREGEEVNLEEKASEEERQKKIAHHLLQAGDILWGIQGALMLADAFIPQWFLPTHKTLKGTGIGGCMIAKYILWGAGKLIGGAQTLGKRRGWGNLLVSLLTDAFCIQFLQAFKEASLRNRGAIAIYEETGKRVQWCKNLGQGYGEKILGIE